MDLLAIVTCIATLFAELGGCTPDLTHNRQSILGTSPNRNIVVLSCNEAGSETMATFWNGSTRLNSIPSATHTHSLTPETEAGIVCSNEEGDSNEIRLAALPFDMEVQDDPVTVQCVRRGPEVQLPCEYPPGHLRELYSVQWRFRVHGSTVLVPPGFGLNGFPLPSGSLLSIDANTFALRIAVDQLEQTGDQFHCDVNVRRNDIGPQQQTTVRYIGAIVELKVEEPVQIVQEVEDIRVSFSEPASFTCVAMGTDVTISWEIDGQSYTDCSSAGFCVSMTEIDSMTVNSTISVITSLPNSRVVQCTASQMCAGTVSSSGELFFASPTITDPLTIFVRPTSEVILESRNNNATFTCGARGITRPEITWRFNSMDVQENENTANEVTFSDEYTTVRHLTLNQVQDTDSGSVICRARIPGPDIFVQQQKATLSVLTGNFDPEIQFVDTTGDLQVSFQLPAAIQDELQFRVKYIRAGTNEEREQPIVGDFINKQSISFTISSGDLPFSQFGLQIAMEVDGVLGDFTSIVTVSSPNGSSVLPISVSVVGVSVIILLILIITAVGVLFVRRKKKLTQHIYENVSLYALEMQYNITLNDAYVPGTSSSDAQRNAANNCSHEAVEGDEMRDGDDQPGSAHEHEQDAGVCYQAGDDYEQAQYYELAGGAYDKFRGQDYEQTSDPYERVQDYEQQQASDTYDQFRGQDYEQTSDPYERVQDYEQQQASGVYDQVQSYKRLQLSDPYDQVQSYERLQLSDPYDQVQSYEQLHVSDQVGDNEQLQATDQVQSYEQPQAHTVSHIQGYELVVQSRYCGLIQLKEI